MISSIRDNNPTLYLENKYLYRRLRASGPLSLEPIPLGVAKVVREGRDVTLITYSAGVSQALEVAEELDKEGISVEVIDVRTLVPLDVETLVNSVKKTSRAVVLHEAAKRLGYGAEIAATLQEEAFFYLDQPVARIAAKNTPTPTSPPLEDAVIPQPAQIAEASKVARHSVASERVQPTTTSSWSAVARVGTRPRCMRPRPACPSPWSRRTRSAAPACTGAASRPRRCCMRPRCSAPSATLRRTASSCRTAFNAGAGLGGGEQRKAGIVNQLTKGLQGLLKRRKVTVIGGRGTLNADGSVSAAGQTLKGRATILCTGSVPRAIPGMDLDGERDHQLRPRHQQHADHAARAGGGDRRRRHRRRVRLRLHRSRRRHHAARGDEARRAAARTGP